MKRPSIADLAKAAEVSVSTVDRVLSGRLPVRHATAERVLATAERIGFHSAIAIRHRLIESRPERSFGFVLQQRSSPFYKMLGGALTEAVKAAPGIRGRSRVEFLSDLAAASVAESLLKLGRVTDALGVVAADHPFITAAVEELRDRGVPVIALISRLTAPTAGYVGLDNWKVGRTAAWFVVSLARRQGAIGILVGSHRYRCQDECEMSFRSYIREHSPETRLLEPLVSLEDERYAYEAVQDLLVREPDLAGLYLGGGGGAGAVRALREGGVGQPIATVALDQTEDNLPSLMDGTVKVVLSHPIERLAAETVEVMAAACAGALGASTIERILPMNIQTAESI